MTNYINLISKYRTSIMGIAILWVIFAHCHSVVSMPMLIKFPLFILGFGGVDIFLFISGFGIYHSLNKNLDIENFFIRRIIRFLPIIPIIIFFCIYFPIAPFHKIIGYLTLENFWLGDMHFNFLSYIFLCYILSPLFFDIINKHSNNTRRKLFFFFILFIMTIPFWCDDRLRGVARIPIYFLGMCASELYTTNKNISSTFVFITKLTTIFAFSSFILIYTVFYEYRIEYGLIYYCMFFFIPGFIMFLCKIFEYTNNIKFLKNLPLNILSFIGKRSLEIFMFDSLVIIFLDKNLPFLYHFLFAIIGGIIYSFIFNFAKNKFLNSILFLYNKKY